MTELEKQLLSALEQLQQDYSQRLDEWESAFAEWRSMCGLMQRENAVLNERVSDLSTQVLSLSEQLCPGTECHRAPAEENEYQKTLELERQPQKTYRGPTL
jgi:septal ring factor EnvC (AmiA/AmiB activator)